AVLSQRGRRHKPRCCEHRPRCRSSQQVPPCQTPVGLAHDGILPCFRKSSGRPACQKLETGDGSLSRREDGDPPRETGDDAIDSSEGHNGSGRECLGYRATKSVLASCSLTKWPALAESPTAWARQVDQ